MKRLLLSAALLPALLALAQEAPAQTVAAPTITRADPAFSGSSSVIWPALYDSSRVRVMTCAQVRFAGSTKAEVCRSLTGPWIRHIVAPPAPPPAPPPPAPLPPPPPPPVVVKAIVLISCSAGSCLLDGRTSTGALSYAWLNPAGAVIGTASTLSAVQQATGSYLRTLRVTGAGGVTNSVDFRVPQLPPPPDTTVAKLDIKPDSIKLAPGQQIQFCALLIFANGATALGAGQRPQCDGIYAGLGPILMPNPAQQAIADASCIDWQASGGTITVDPCMAGGLGSFGRSRASRIYQVQISKRGRYLVASR